MPLGKIHLRPGITVELTPTANEGGWSSSQLIRFFAGQVQKYGGWSRLPAVPALVGQCRGLLGWADLVGTAHLAAGTEQRLYTLTGGQLSDVTPVVQTTNAAPALATTAGSASLTITDATYLPAAGDWVNIVTPVSQGGGVIAGTYQVLITSGGSVYTVTGIAPAVATAASGGAVAIYATTAASATVTVTLPAHGLVAGSAYVIALPTTIAGLVLSGSYSVSAVPTANSFQFVASALASATTSVTMNGGNMQLQYLLPSGAAVNTTLGGWGTGDWGAGDWGLTNAGTTSALVSKARTWSLDHFGQDLIASPDLGPIYHWPPPLAVPAVLLGSAAPPINRVVFCVAQVQIIVACGSSSLGTYYPTLIRWCDAGDFTDWNASATNQAGSYQLSSGSYVTAALAVGLGALIWTDTDLWSMTYQGLPYVFGFNRVAVACEALSKKAPAVVGTMVVWPSSRGFFRYDGGAVAPVECPVWDFFFNNLDTTQQEQVCAAVNTAFNEVAWFFPVAGGGVSYVKWNYLENAWDYGTLTRTAWCDHSPYGNPIATDAQGVLYVHESGADADGSPLVSYAQSGYYDLQDGNELQYVNVVIPDFVASIGSTIELSILATNYPGDTPRSHGPFPVVPGTRRINVSLRGRQVAFRIGSSDLGSFWRMGAVRYASVAAGRR